MRRRELPADGGDFRQSTLQSSQRHGPIVAVLTHGDDAFSPFEEPQQRLRPWAELRHELVDAQGFGPAGLQEGGDFVQAGSVARCGCRVEPYTRQHLPRGLQHPLRRELRDEALEQRIRGRQRRARSLAGHSRVQRLQAVMLLDLGLQAVPQGHAQRFGKETIAAPHNIALLLDQRRRLGGRDPEFERQIGHRQTASGRFIDEPGEPFRRLSKGVRPRLGTPRGPGVSNDSPTDRRQRRCGSQDEPISGARKHWRIGGDPHGHGPSGLCPSVARDDACPHLACPNVQSHLGPGPKRVRALEQGKIRAQMSRVVPGGIGTDEHIAPRELVMIHASQRQRDP